MRPHRQRRQRCWSGKLTLKMIRNGFGGDVQLTRELDQVVALRLRYQQPDRENPLLYDYPTMINRFLPDDIRVLGCKLVDSEFNARWVNPRYSVSHWSRSQHNARSFVRCSTTGSEQTKGTTSTSFFRTGLTTSVKWRKRHRSLSACTISATSARFVHSYHVLDPKSMGTRLSMGVFFLSLLAS